MAAFCITVMRVSHLIRTRRYLLLLICFTGLGRISPFLASAWWEYADMRTLVFDSSSIMELFNLSCARLQIGYWTSRSTFDIRNKAKLPFSQRERIQSGLTETSKGGAGWSQGSGWALHERKDCKVPLSQGFRHASNHLKVWGSLEWYRE